MNFMLTPFVVAASQMRRYDMILFVAAVCLVFYHQNLTISNIFMKQADSTGVQQAKDTVGWFNKALLVLYDASFSAHFSLDGPKIDHDNGSEEESEGHDDDVSRLS